MKEVITDTQKYKGSLENTRNNNRPANNDNLKEMGQFPEACNFLRLNQEEKYKI